MNVPRIDVGMPTDIPFPDDDAPASEGWFQRRRGRLSESRMRRLERDSARGYRTRCRCCCRHWFLWVLTRFPKLRKSKESFVSVLEGSFPRFVFGRPLKELCSWSPT